MKPIKRVLSIWLPHWPADRFRRAQARRLPVGPGSAAKSGAKPEPLIFSYNAQSTQRLAAVDEVAAAFGLFPQMRLGDARAMLPGLLAVPYAPGDDARDLQALAFWCGRFSPWVRPEKKRQEETKTGPKKARKEAPKETLPEPLYDGLRLDISGCAHLFGGEAALAAEILGRLQAFGFQAQVAIADGIGAAWALARFHPQAAAGPVIVADPVALPDILGSFSVQALRLPDEMVMGLERLGLRRIAELYQIPAKGLTARFGSLPSRRLAQALGQADEPLSPDQPAEQFWTRMDFAEPIGHGDDISRAADQLVTDLCAILHRADAGARRLCLRFFLADGTVQEIHIGCARASREVKHLRRLLGEQLPVLEASFGADAMTLQAERVEILAAAQMALDPKAPTVKTSRPKTSRSKKPASGNSVPDSSGVTDFADPDLGLLVDRLGNRLGLTNLARFLPRDSHIPEQAVRVIGPLDPGPPTHGWQDHGCHDSATNSRPLLMLPAPEPVETMAEIPDGPPMMFRWRGNLHRVVKVDGPERIAPEWWRAKNADQGLDGAAHARVTRDYFRVEDHHGARFWLYRRGLYKKPGRRRDVISTSIVPALSPTMPDAVMKPEVGAEAEVDTGAETGAETEVAPPRWYLQGIFP